MFMLNAVRNIKSVTSLAIFSLFDIFFDIIYSGTSTKTATQTANTSQDAVKPEVIEIKLGCKNSLSLSALAIVPALGLGVALITKKKEDR